MNLSYHLIYNFSLKDLIDILLVAVLLYYVFLLIRGTRAVQIAFGVGVLFLFLGISKLLKFETIYWILHFFPIGLAILLPIVFQPELRRVLSQLGREAMLRSSLYWLTREKFLRMIDEVVYAANLLSRNKTGALIVLERETGLREFIRSGTLLNADVSAKLLLSLFNPKSPLHDGAVIIRGNKIIAAGCYLPLSEDLAMETKSGLELGTRHRAALGLGEQTDAIVLVVSEESGIISLVEEAKLVRNLEEKSLQKILKELLAPPPSLLKGKKIKKSEKPVPNA